MAVQGADKLSKRQREVLAFFDETVRSTGAPPTIRQVMRKCGLKSPRGAELQLRALASAGLVRHLPHETPAYRPKYLQAGSTVSVVGRAHAGEPAEQMEEKLGEVHLPWRVGPRAFAIRAQGDSMVGAHILDGDTVVVDPDERATTGRVVVVEVRREQAIKVLSKSKSGAPLFVAASPGHRPVKPAEGDRIYGCVVAIVRNLIAYRYDRVASRRG